MGSSSAIYVPSWLEAPAFPATLDRDVWMPSFARNDAGELTVDGTSVRDLQEQFGTPAYVFSETTFRARAAEFRDAFTEAFAAHGAEVSVYYAGKSFLCAAVARWAREEGLNLDTASGGELALALASGMPGERIALHGNNKSDAEIRRALERSVGRLVADSVPEVFQIQRIAQEMGVQAPVVLRVTPGVHAETHDFIATAHEDQKFGLSLAENTSELAVDRLEAGQAERIGLRTGDSSAVLAALLALEAENIDLRGIHCHIGSQIFEAEGFALAAQRVLGFMAALAERTGAELPELDLGGGYGIGYVPGDRPRPTAEIAASLAEAVAQACAEHGLAVPHLSVEPGRALSGPSGMTLYTVGTVKDVAVEDEGGAQRVRRYVSVDGGMSDNARPVLYDADYHAALASREPTGEQTLCRVVGKHCESGDVVVRYCYLPADLKAGDLLAVAATGAYCWSLSSNYNYLPRPGVVATADGREPRTIVRGETEHDLLARDAEL